MNSPAYNPCLDCGACCKSFRVSFYWAEALERGLPESMTEQLTPHHSCMKGTNSSEPYCMALGKGNAGPMACAVYAHRPSPCREVEPGDAKCSTARARHRLAPFPPVTATPSNEVLPSCTVHIVCGRA